MKRDEFLATLSKIQEGKFFDKKLVIAQDPFGYEEEKAITDDDVILLCQVLIDNHHITKLNLSANKISCIGAKALSELTTLKSLDVSYNNLQADSVAALAGSTSLKKLKLEGNSICYDENFREIFVDMIGALTKNNCLEYLDLQDSKIPSNIIAPLIKSNTSLKHLVTGKNLGDEAFEFLEDNKTLKELYIMNCCLTDKSAEYISKNIALQKLFISNSKIGDYGVKYLYNHNSLKELILSDCNITKYGLEIFQMSNIENIDIISSHLADNDVLEFKENRVLKSQQNYYYKLIENNIYPDIAPDINDFNSIQDAINTIQYKMYLEDI